jgi:hypothetical protein
MLCPPVVAVISMFDPAAFNNASVWLQRLSPAVSLLDYVKAGLTIVSAVVVWKSRPGTTGGREVGLPDLREVLSSQY